MDKSWSTLLIAAGAVLVAGFALGGLAVVAGGGYGPFSVVPGIAAYIAVPLAFLGFHWLQAPTVEGRAVMDRIEGFRQYLGVAEEDRLNALNPPDKTPELFERFLPYALALDVENRGRSASPVSSPPPERRRWRRPGIRAAGGATIRSRSRTSSAVRCRRPLRRHPARPDRAAAAVAAVAAARPAAAVVEAAAAAGRSAQSASRLDGIGKRSTSS